MEGAHLPRADICCRFKWRRKSWEQGEGRTVIKQSPSQEIQVVIGDSHKRWVAPCLRMDQARPCYNESLLPGRGGFVSCHRMFIHQSCPSWIPRWLPGDCRRGWLRAKDTDTKWRPGCQAFLLLSVNLRAQIRCRCFSAKAVFKYLL
jgi:hypothetical protein